MADPVFKGYGTIGDGGATNLATLGSTITGISAGDLVVLLVSRNAMDEITGVSANGAGITSLQLLGQTGLMFGPNWQFAVYGAIATAAASSLVVTATWSAANSYATALAVAWSNGGSIVSLTPLATTFHNADGGTVATSSTDRIAQSLVVDTGKRALLIASGVDWNAIQTHTGQNSFARRLPVGGNSITFLYDRVVDAGTYLGTGTGGRFGTTAAADEYLSIALALEIAGSGTDINVNLTGLAATATLGTATFSGIIPRVDYVGISSAVEANNANSTLSEPAGVAQGDLLIAAFSHRGTIGFQTPTSWTKLLDQSSGNTSTTANASIASGELFYIVRGASAPALTFTKESGTADVSRGIMVALRGQDTTTPIRGSLQTTLAANSLTVVTTGTISPQLGDAVVAFFCGADNIAWSAEQINGAPTALTEIHDSNTATGADTALGVAYTVLTDAAISNQTVQATASGTNSRHVVLVVDVAPLGGTPVTVNPTGIGAASARSNPTVTAAASTTATGLSATASRGAPTVTALASVALTGLGATASRGTPAVSIPASAAVAGRSATVSYNNVSVTGLASTALTGRSATASLGVPVVGATIDVSVTGRSAAASLGTPSVTAPVSVSITGLAASAALGTVVASSVSSVSVTGLSATSARGSVTTTASVTYTPAGVSAQASTKVPTITALGNVSATLAGAQASVGTPVVGVVSVAFPTGLGATSGLGSTTVTAAASVALTGQHADASVGVVSSATNVTVPISGLLSAAAIGAIRDLAVVDVWWDQVPGNYGYRVKWGPAIDSYTNSADIAQDVNDYTITSGVLYGGRYYWTVTALDVSGIEQSWATPVYFDTDPATSVFLGGIPAQVRVGAPSVAQGIDVPLTGRAATSSLRVPAVSISSPVAVAGLSAALQQGSGNAHADANTAVIGSAVTASVLLPSSRVVANASVPVVGRSAASAIGSGSGVVQASASALAEGQSADAQFGDLITQQTVNYAFAGVAAASQYGQVTITIAGAISVGLTGLPAISSIGTAAIQAGAATPVTGHAAFAYTGLLDVRSHQSVTIVGAAGATSALGYPNVDTNAGVSSAYPQSLLAQLTVGGVQVTTDVAVALSPGFYSQTALSAVSTWIGTQHYVTGVGSVALVGSVDFVTDANVEVSSPYAISQFGNVQCRITTVEDVGVNVTMTKYALVQVGRVNVQTYHHNPSWYMACIPVLLRGTRRLP